MQLGDTVKSKVSDFQGLAVGSLETFSGFTQFLVAGKDKDEVPKSLWIDVVVLEVLKEATENRTPTSDPKFTLGAAVRHKASGWTGHISSILLYLNGCVRYEVEGPGKNRVPGIIATDEAMIDLIEEAPLERTTPARTGGDRGSSSLRI